MVLMWILAVLGGAGRGRVVISHMHVHALMLVYTYTNTPGAQRILMWSRVHYECIVCARVHTHTHTHTHTHINVCIFTHMSKSVLHLTHRDASTPDASYRCGAQHITVVCCVDPTL